jgi:uncharacterized membrane protein YqjE
MEPAPDSFLQLTANSREVARTLLTVGANRLELLKVEVQEERVLLLRAIFLAFGAAAFGLLGGITLTGMVVFLFYEMAPVTVMLALTALYGAAAVMIHWRLSVLLRTWRNLPSTFDQLRKDRVCLETIFE